MVWQDEYVQTIAVVRFLVPPILGFLWNGWAGALGAFLLAGITRIVALQHCTFFINSACHIWPPALLDEMHRARFVHHGDRHFRRGYHNYHHEFQHDYRNGVKPWNFDPTKWIIWTLSKTGIIRNLRRVAQDKILLAEQHRKAEIEFENAAKTASSEDEEGVALARVEY